MRPLGDASKAILAILVWGIGTPPRVSDFSRTDDRLQCRFTAASCAHPALYLFNAPIALLVCWGHTFVADRISEESEQLPYEERRDYECCWVVDPLDGTKVRIPRGLLFSVLSRMRHNIPLRPRCSLLP